MKVRESIDRDISRIEAHLEWYDQNGGTERWEAQMQHLADRKERLLAQAQHYDQEQAAGYESPATHRWRKN